MKPKKNKPMPENQKKISPTVENVTVDQEGHDQVITIVLRYTGEENIIAEIQEGEELTLELPSKPQP